MMHINTTKITFAICAAIALLSGQIAFAQDTDTQSARAAAEFDKALTAGRAGNYEGACRGFKNAAIMYENAVYSLLAKPMATDDDRSYVKAYAKNLQDSANDSKRLADTVCGLKNDSFPPSSSNSGQSNIIRSTEPDFVRPDMSNEVRAAQSAIDTAYGNASEAARLYSAKNFKAACAKARASATQYEQARVQVIAIPKISHSYNEVGPNDLDVIAGIAAVSGRDAEEFYCKPPLANAGFQVELKAFAAMISALHLERGSTTALTSEQAMTMRGSCTTDLLYAARSAGSPFADALVDGCQSFVNMYNMKSSYYACRTLKDAKGKLNRAEPKYASQTVKLHADFGKLQKAFGCDSSDINKPLVVSTAQLITQQPAQPATKLDIKPLPNRPL